MTFAWTVTSWWSAVVAWKKTGSSWSSTGTSLRTDVRGRNQNVHPVADLLDGGPPLAFDHARILADGVERARAKLEYSPLATAFCGPEFTVAELRRVYEAVWGVALDPRNFSRKALGTPGLLEATGCSTSGGAGRPAALYRAVRPVVRPAAEQGDPAVLPAVLNPPLLRPGS
ncbi:hypothetical protein UQW22_06510 [Isoptericola halotolerans]|uniref:NUDIX hydrolase n=1 Tax=Isoptericola halotolerans TaxID=300560 RepID=UPI00388D6B60